MNIDQVYLGLAGILAASAPLLFATLGETITERAGIINLSLNGLILLSAMGSFAVSVLSGSIIFGFITGILIGILVSSIIAFTSITLKQSQVAVGFVMALLCRDLSYFLGNPYMGLAAPRLSSTPIPVLKDIPLLGVLFFNHDVITYFSFTIIILLFIWMFKTKPGLVLQGIGERPSAAFARGANIKLNRYIYTLVGGALVGLAGPTYSLSIKAGWKGTISGLDGIGWIALALTIFGGWNPIRAAFGAYLFGFLQWLGLVLQPYLPGVPSQLLQVSPFPLMIMTLLLVNIGNTDWLSRTLMDLPEQTRFLIGKIIRILHASPPASLGIPFDQD
jgi:simple sugar transport system permease protein